MRTSVALLIGLTSGIAGGSMAGAYDTPPSVHAEAKGDDAASVSASMDVAAPPAAVWSTLIDCAHATQFMPRLLSCRILRKGPGDRWEIREHRLKGGLFRPVMRNVFRADFIPDRSLTFHRVAGDWKRSDGRWTLAPIAGGAATHVTYQTNVALNGPVPVDMVRSAIEKGMPESMLALRREVLARAAAAKGGGPSS